MAIWTTSLRFAVVLYILISIITTIGREDNIKTDMFDVGKYNISFKPNFVSKISDDVKNNLIIGIGIPKTGSNKLGAMISEGFQIVSCVDEWYKLPLGTAREAMYCSWGNTIRHPKIQEDVARRFGANCSYFTTHQDLSISRVMEGMNVSYVTMMREPISRLVSGCNYDLGKKCSWDTIENFTRDNRGYGMPNRMTKMIAGVDPVCSLELKIVVDRFGSDDEALLRRAKFNLENRFIFVGVLERLDESIALLPKRASKNVVLPEYASKGGTFYGDKKKLEKLLGPYIHLDQQLYRFANELLDKRTKQVEFVNTFTLNSTTLPTP